MVVKPTSFKAENIYKGDRAEDIIAFILRAEGYYVVITADLQERNTNGAPGARNDDSFITLPDLDVAKKGYRGWCEVKYKGASTFHRITQRDEHGIGIRKFKMYQRIQQETGTIVYIFVYEANSGAVLYNSLDVLLTDGFFRTWTGKRKKGNDKGGMIYFARSNFNLWGKVALLGKDIYQQLDLFSLTDTKGQGDKLFDVIRHHNGAL